MYKRQGCTGVPSEKNGWRGENFAGWCFRDADRAIRAAATSLDVDERKAQYLLHQKLWTQEAVSYTHLSTGSRLASTSVSMASDSSSIWLGVGISRPILLTPGASESAWLVSAIVRRAC